MLDILVAEVVLQGSRIVTVIGEPEAAGVPQHVRMDGKRHLGGFAEALDEMVNRHARKRTHKPL